MFWYHGDQPPGSTPGNVVPTELNAAKISCISNECLSAGPVDTEPSQPSARDSEAPSQLPLSTNVSTDRFPLFEVAVNTQVKRAPFQNTHPQF